MTLWYEDAIDRTECDQRNRGGNEMIKQPNLSLLISLILKLVADNKVYENFSKFDMKLINTVTQKLIIVTHIHRALCSRLG